MLLKPPCSRTQLAQGWPRRALQYIDWTSLTFSYPKVQSRIFNTTFNPTGARLGNKVLRQHLRGPARLAYYPRRLKSPASPLSDNPKSYPSRKYFASPIKILRKDYPMYDIEDEDEEARVDKLRQLKARGKGAPAKKKSRAESKRFTKRKPGKAGG